METQSSEAVSTTTPRKAKVWKYFKLLTADDKSEVYAQCLIANCKDKIKYLKSTTALNSHICSQHSNEYKELQDEASYPSQTKIKIDLRDLKFKELNKEQTKRITESIANFISIDMRPIDVVTGEGFIGMIKTLEPRYKIPDRTNFSKNIIPSIYDKMKARIVRDLENVDGFAFAFDDWQSFSCKSFMTLTCHFIDNDFNLKNYLLSTMEVLGSHTGVHTAKIISEVLDNFGLKEKTNTKFFAVSDSAGSMRKIAKELSWPHIYCFAHALHNTLINSLKTIEGLTDKCTKVSKYFRSSTQHSHILLNMQEELYRPI